MRVARGITLIELLTVLVVIAILAGIAIPSYSRYLLRTHRTEATTALMRIGAAQETFFLQHHRYSDDLASAPPVGLGTGTTTPHGRYELAIELDGGLAWTARAAPRSGGGQERDGDCTAFTLDESGGQGAQGAAADPATECWR